MNAQSNDILYQAANVWKSLTEYLYIFTYGYKNKLYTINLTFIPENFPHLAGFQYLKDLSMPRYNSGKIMDKILSGTITLAQIKNSIHYTTFVKPRLEALIHILDILETDFKLFSYMPRMYPFTTNLKADYLISSHLDFVSFIFIIQNTSNKNFKHDCLCCSAFTKGERDYEANQRPLTILKKERIRITTGTSKVLYDKLTTA